MTSRGVISQVLVGLLGPLLLFAVPSPSVLEAIPTTATAYTYDAALNTGATLANGAHGDAAHASNHGQDLASSGGFSPAPSRFIAAETASAADKAAYDYATSSAKLDHVFAGKHNFDPLVQQFGSREAVTQQFLTGLRGLTPASGPRVHHVEAFVSSSANASDGRSFNMPGGGTEMQFPYAIPPEFLKVLN